MEHYTEDIIAVVGAANVEGQMQTTSTNVDMAKNVRRRLIAAIQDRALGCPHLHQDGSRIASRVGG